MDYYNWQNLTWIVFHKVALNYDEIYKDKYIKFFRTFKYLIPCSICKNHYCEMIDNNFIIEKYDNLFNWSMDIHNNVNNSLKKRRWSYEEGKNHYNKLFLSAGLMKQFLFDYIRYNFKKGPIKTENLINMIKCFSCVIPRKPLRNSLVEFNNKFELNRNNFKKWLTAFILLLKKN